MTLCNHRDRATTVPPIAVRHARQGDVGFIMKSWLRSYNNTRVHKHDREAGYWTAHKAVIATLMARSTTLMAVNVEDSDQIFGFMVAESGSDPLVVHYAYVKSFARKKRIGTRLLLEHQADGQTDNVVATCLGPSWTHGYVKRQGWGLSLNAPYYHTIGSMEARL